MMALFGSPPKILRTSAAERAKRLKLRASQALSSASMFLASLNARITLLIG